MSLKKISENIVLILAINYTTLLYGMTNMSILIDSFLVGILPHTDHFHGNGHNISWLFFVFESPQIQNKHGPSAI